MSTAADLRDAIYHGAVKRIATPMIGGVITSTIMELIVYPAIFFLWRSRSFCHFVSPHPEFVTNGALTKGQA